TRGVMRLARRPERVLAVAAVLALAGWVLDTQTKVESDVQKLVPQDLAALKDLNALQRATGVGGQLDVVVDADDVARPEVVEWMTSYQRTLLDRYGFSSERGCGRAALCPAFSLPDLFDERPRDARQIRALLDVVPPYFSQSVITPNRRTATLSFGIRLMPLERQKEVIDVMRDELDPPDGVRAELAGLPVLAAEANAAVSSDWRRLLTLVAGLVAVFVVLLVALRHWRRAAVPLIPIVLATGWSSFVLFALRIPLNPMSVTLGALVIAISTEFSVLLSERYRQERAAGHEPAEALERTYRSTGAAVLASGVTAIAGFAVLVVSDIRMLRDFGFVTVVDLTVSLLGVLVVLPSVLLLAERGVRLSDLWLRLPRPRLRRARAA
ncbi:MAG TPA: MMPL family transporter, partial [Solirubrobacteraceae bacterium]|nr:MMPL family transporter [Solirubrobacteraceae bacterium]